MATHQTVINILLNFEIYTSYLYIIVIIAVFFFLALFLIGSALLQHIIDKRAV